VIAPMIIEEIMKDNKGIAHIGSNRRSLYEIAKTRRPNVIPISHKDMNFVVPEDTSFEF